MGTYYINAGKEEALVLIKQFASECGLGEPHVQWNDKSFLKAVAPSKSGLESIRCTWVCKEDSHGLTITLKVLPPILKIIGFYIAAFFGAVGVLIFGYLLNRWGLGALEPEVIILVMVAIVLETYAFTLYCKIGYGKVELAMLTAERCFYEKLNPYSPQVLRSSYIDLMILGGAVILLVPPLIFLLFGLIHRIPLLSIPLIVWFAALMIVILAEKMATRWPHTVWRVMLISWVSKCTIVSCLTLLGIVYFTFFGAEISCIRKAGFADASEFVKLISHPIWRTPQELVSQGILVTNATVFQQMVERNQFNKYSTIIIAELSRLIVFCLVLLLLKWAIKGFTDWTKGWLLTHPGSLKPSLSPPASTEEDVSRHFIPDLNVLLTLLTGSVGNILNLAITVEILSVLFFDRAAFSYTIAQAIGWIVIDFSGAVHGDVHRNLLGVCFLIIIMLPTWTTVVIWSTVIICSQAQRLRWIMFPLNNESLSNVMNRISFAIGNRMPILCITEQNKACFTVKVPMLFGRPCVVFSRPFLENLNSSELEAAIAHELVHVKYDARAIRLTQWASVLSLFPCNAFALLLNMGKREMRADRIASKVVGNRDVLMTALVKVCIGQVSASKVEVAASERLKDNVALPVKLWYRIANYVLLLHPFFWPESILGYTHPAVQNRLAALQISGLTSNKEATGEKHLH